MLYEADQLNLAAAENRLATLPPPPRLTRARQPRRAARSAGRAAAEAGRAPIPPSGGAATGAPASAEGGAGAQNDAAQGQMGRNSAPVQKTQAIEARPATFIPTPARVYSPRV